MLFEWDYSLFSYFDVMILDDRLALWRSAAMAMNMIG